MEAVTPLTEPGKVWVGEHGLLHPQEYERPASRFLLLSIWLDKFPDMDFDVFQDSVLSDCDRVYGGVN